MPIEQLRALIAVLIRGHDVLAACRYKEPITVRTSDEYLQDAQYLLEASYKNYSHPVDPATKGVGGMELLAED